MITLKNISKRFNNYFAVNNINLTIKENEIFGILGTNGAGKTTLFRMILNIFKPTKGEIILNGLNYKKIKKILIGYLPEERGLHGQLTVKNEIMFLGKLKGMSSDHCKNEMEYWLEKFRILEHRDKKIDSLSKGNQQKVQLITSIIHSPKILILDEPFSGLDPVNVKLLKDAVIELKKKGTTIIFSSHRMEHVEELCDRICILKKGNMITVGNIEDIKKQYQKKEIYIEGDLKNLNFERIEGIESVSKHGKGKIIKITNESVSRDVYKESKKSEYIEKLILKDITLNEIFIKIMEDNNETF
ncbi:ATP-binding cassette domain-containing protein [Staphylococcus pseudintermedius]